MFFALLLMYMLIRTEDKITRYIYAMTSWMSFCFIITELLSAFGGIKTANLWGTWLVLDVILVVINIYFIFRDKKKISVIDFSKFDKCIMIWLIFAAFMLAVAIKTVPDNYDSMTYHLPRLFHWMQNGTVAHYATSIDRQIGSPIGAAYVNLHIYTMCSGGDRFINLLQCCSYLTNGWLVYAIAKKLGSSKQFCNMAMLLFYTMPIAVAEAFTTQVDNFSALWMLATIYLLLELLYVEKAMKLDKDTIGRVVGLSLCVGYGYLAKPSIGIGLLLFAIWLLIVVIKRKDNPKVVAIYIAIAAVILGFLLVPGFLRNIETFGAISAPNVGKRQLVGTLNPIYLFVNFIKNLAFNMPTVWVYDSGTIIYTVVMGIAALLHVDINNPGISEDGQDYLVYNALKYSHDRAVNPVIVYLLIVCLVLWFIRNRKKYADDIRNSYFVASALSFAVFCVFLRWEPFVCRYMLSYMAILCPALAGQLELTLSDKKDIKWNKVGYAICVLLVFVSVTEVTGLIQYHTKIALEGSRYSGYFGNNKYEEEYYRDVVDFINENEYRNIGLWLGETIYEYPLIPMIEDYDRIEHVNIDNLTKKYEDETFIPDVIISIHNESGKIVCHGEEYEMVENVTEDLLYVYVPIVY